MLRDAVCSMNVRANSIGARTRRLMPKLQFSDHEGRGKQIVPNSNGNLKDDATISRKELTLQTQRRGSFATSRFRRPFGRRSSTYTSVSGSISSDRSEPSSSSTLSPRSSEVMLLSRESARGVVQGLVVGHVPQNDSNENDAAIAACLADEQQLQLRSLSEIEDAGVGIGRHDHTANDAAIAQHLAAEEEAAIASVSLLTEQDRLAIHPLVASTHSANDSPRSGQQPIIPAIDERYDVDADDGSILDVISIASLSDDLSTEDGVIVEQTTMSCDELRSLGHHIDATGRSDSLVADNQPIAKKEKSDLQDVCVVCLDRRANACFIPCGHVCACEICAALLPSPQLCPLCRFSIEEVALCASRAETDI